jgi:hypothetical protein
VTVDFLEVTTSIMSAARAGDVAVDDDEFEDEDEQVNFQAESFAGLFYKNKQYTRQISDGNASLKEVLAKAEKSRLLCTNAEFLQQFLLINQLSSRIEKVVESQVVLSAKEVRTIDVVLSWSRIHLDNYMSDKKEAMQKGPKALLMERIMDVMRTYNQFEGVELSAAKEISQRETTATVVCVGTPAAQRQGTCKPSEMLQYGITLSQYLDVVAKGSTIRLFGNFTVESLNIKVSGLVLEAGEPDVVVTFTQRNGFVLSAPNVTIKSLNLVNEYVPNEGQEDDLPNCIMCQSSGCIVDRCSIRCQEGRGIVCVNNGRLVVRKSVVDFCFACGIRCVASQVTIDDCVIRNVQHTAVGMIGEKAIVFMRNTQLTTCTDALYLAGNGRLTIQSCIFTKMQRCGIHLAEGSVYQVSAIALNVSHMNSHFIKNHSVSTVTIADCDIHDVMCFAEIIKHGKLEASKCVFHSSSGPHGFHVAEGGHIEMDNSSIEHVAADAIFVQGETAFAKFVRMHISVCGRDALHCSYGAVVEMSDSRIMHAKRFGIAATTKGRAQIVGTVVDSSLHSGIAALTSEDTTPELSESSSSIKQPMHAGLPAGHVVAKKCSVRGKSMQIFNLCDKNKGHYFNHLQVLNSGQYGAFTEGGKIV